MICVQKLKEYSNDSKTGKAYSFLFSEIKKKYSTLSFDAINNSIGCLAKHSNSKLIPAEYLLDPITEKVEILKKKLAILTNNDLNKQQIAEELISKSIQRERLTSPSILDIQLDRLFQTRSIYTSKTQSVSETVKGAILRTLLELQMRLHMDERLTQALDFASLVRLSMICGEESIEVPSYEKVELILASTYFFYLKKFEGLSDEGAKDRVKAELDIDVKYRELKDSSSSLALLYSKELFKESSPIIEVLQNMMKLIQDLQERLKEATANIQGSEEFLTLYKDVNKSFLQLSRSIN